MISPLAKILTPLGRSYGAAAFDPSTIPGLRVWYDFSDTSRLFQDVGGTTPAVSDGDIVGRVNDKTINAINALQSVTSKKPLYKANIQNGLGGVKFDNADDFVQMSSTLVGSSQTIFACVKWGSSADQEEYLFGDSTYPPPIQWGYDDNTKGTRLVSNTGNYFGGLKLTDVANSTRLHTLSIASNVGTSYINGQVQSGTVAIGGDFNVGLLAAFLVGVSYARFFGGHFLAMLAYTGTLSAGNQAAVEGYINNRWAVY